MGTTLSGSFVRCSKSCGGGIQARTRGVKVQAAHGGAKCAGAAKERRFAWIVGEGIRQIRVDNLKNVSNMYNYIIYIYI